jgi:serine protease Do
MNNTWGRFLLLAGAFALLSGAGAAGMGAREPRAPAQQTTTIVINDQGGFTQAISRVADLLTPAVVHIETVGAAPRQAPEYSYGPLQHQPSAPVTSLGSGVIISPDGYIITNNHVVEDAESITVEMYGGAGRQATLVGTDPPTDLAVLKIDPAPGTAYARLGDSDALKVGEWVIAIGSPRGLDWTVTAGIVSAKHRTDIGALGPSGYEDFIQTDASINPGNSGGPLIDLQGEVIGINSLIVSGSQGSEGLGFAIPSRMAREISASLIAGGKVVRGYMGLETQDVTPDIASGLSLPPETRGALVDDTDSAGPASAAGIQRGDIVTAYSGSVIDSSLGLRTAVAASRPGAAVRITLIRKGAAMTLTATVEDLERANARMARINQASRLGITVEAVTEEMAARLGLRHAAGVLVTAVVDGSAASQARLDPGDVILMVGDSPVRDAEGFSSLVTEAISKGKVLFLIRDGRTGRIGVLPVPLGRR